MQSKIKEILNRQQRFRESSIRGWLTPDQLAFVESQNGTTLKEKFLRAAGEGICKCCGKESGYVEKLRFYTYCSDECERASHGSRKTDLVEERLHKWNLECSNLDEYHDNKSELRVTCERGHPTTMTGYYLFFQCKGCQTCIKEDRQAASVVERAQKADTVVKPKHEYVSRRVVGQPSTKSCKVCGNIMLYKMYGNGDIRAPANYCSSTCKDRDIAQRKGTHFTSLLDKLSEKDNVVYVGSSADSVSTKDKHKFKFTGCGHEYDVIFRNVQTGLYESNLCPECNKWNSGPAQQIKDLLINVLHIDPSRIKENNRLLIAPKELDLVVDDKLAIEVNGNWWHSSLYKPANYHLDKTIRCENAGITLLHLFTDEITDKLNIIEGILRSRLGLTHKINARDCIIKEVISSEADAFLDANHLQGATIAPVRLGLYLDGQLVALMTFRKPYLTDLGQWEIARFASLNGCTVRGGASKLLSAFRKNHKGTIISYADRRYSSGNMYKQLGFKFEHYSGPGFYYVMNGDKRVSRFKLQKHKLSEIWADVDMSKTANQILIEKNIHQIYDCGQGLWVLE